MDILKSFVLDGTEFEVNVLWENDKPYFRAGEIGKILGLAKVRNAIADFDDDEKEEKEARSAGGLQKTMFLSETGLYRLLMISRKPIARPFQKWVMSVIVSIRETGKYELQKHMEELEKEKELHSETMNKYDVLASQFKEIAQKSTHKSIIDAFANKYVVYFGKIRVLHDDVHLIKIGSTKDLRARALSLVEEFGSMDILQVFECPCHLMFERFLQQHKDINKHVYKEAVHKGRVSHEVFALNEVELQTAINIARRNVHRYCQQKVFEGVAGMEIQKLKIETINQCKELIQSVNPNSGISDRQIQEVIDPLYVDPVLLYAENRQHTQVKGDKVQRYSEDGKTLLQTYESAISALRDPTLDSPSRTRIHEAVKDRTVYKDYRWMFLDRSLPDDTVQILGETVEKKCDIRKGYVAMLNLDKTKIMNVFENQKEAGKDRKFKSSAAVCKSIKMGTQSGGHYFMMWYDCPEDLKMEFLTRSELPDKVVPGGKRVAQLHPVSEEVIKVYASLMDVIKEHKFSYATLRNAIKNEFIAKGYRWVMQN